jgi:alkylhydroperoxidase family enzyme
VGREQGLTEEKLAALGDYSDSEVFSDEERTVLRYADAMTETPVEVPDELFERLRELYDEPQIVELTSTLAWENYRARFAHALDFEAEGLSEGAYCPLPVAT